MSAAEARQRMLAAGADSARGVAPTDAFVHHKANDLAALAGISKSGVYRNFSSLEELHIAAMVAIAAEATAEQDAMLASDVVAALDDGAEPVTMVHRLARLSFALGLEEHAVDMSVLLAALADHPDIAAAGLEVEQASVGTMAELYEAIDGRTGMRLLDDTSYEDLAVMIFGVHDGLAIWHHCDPDAVPLDLPGPTEADVGDEWDAFSLAVWAILARLRPEDA